MGCPSTRTVHACTYLQPCGIAPLHQVSQPIHIQLLTMETPTTCASLAQVCPCTVVPISPLSLPPRCRVLQRWTPRSTSHLASSRTAKS